MRTVCLEGGLLGNLLGKGDKSCDSCCDTSCGCADECCESTCGCPLDNCCDVSGGCEDDCCLSDCDSCCEDSCCEDSGCSPCQRAVGKVACGFCPHSSGYPTAYNFNPGPPVGQTAYPYYTTRGPRDFLQNNPPTIGPY